MSIFFPLPLAQIRKKIILYRIRYNIVIPGGGSIIVPANGYENSIISSYWEDAFDCTMIIIVNDIEGFNYDMNEPGFTHSYMGENIKLKIVNNDVDSVLCKFYVYRMKFDLAKINITY